MCSICLNPIQKNMKGTFADHCPNISMSWQPARKWYEYGTTAIPMFCMQRRPPKKHTAKWCLICSINQDLSTLILCPVNCTSSPPSPHGRPSCNRPFLVHWSPRLVKIQLPVVRRPSWGTSGIDIPCCCSPWSLGVSGRNARRPATPKGPKDWEFQHVTTRPCWSLRMVGCKKWKTRIEYHSFTNMGH